MWLLSNENIKGILFSEPEHILAYLKSFPGESYEISWIPTYEPPKEPAEPNVKIGKNYEPVPLSRVKETGE